MGVYIVFIHQNSEAKNGFFTNFLDFRPFLELGNYDQFLTYFWFPICVYKNYIYIPKIMKIALKLNVLLAKNHWRLTFCLPLYLLLNNRYEMPHYRFLYI